MVFFAVGTGLLTGLDQVSLHMVKVTSVLEPFFVGWCPEALPDRGQPLIYIAHGAPYQPCDHDIYILCQLV